MTNLFVIIFDMVTFSVANVTVTTLRHLLTLKMLNLNERCLQVAFQNNEYV